MNVVSLRRHPERWRHAEARRRRVRAGLARVTRRIERRHWRRRLVRRLCVVAVLAAALAKIVATIALASPWPLDVTLRHLAAAPNCDAARRVGLAPAPRGEPGY